MTWTSLCWSHVSQLVFFFFFYSVCYYSCMGFGLFFTCLMCMCTSHCSGRTCVILSDNSVETWTKILSDTFWQNQLDFQPGPPSNTQFIFSQFLIGLLWKIKTHSVYQTIEHVFSIWATLTTCSFAIDNPSCLFTLSALNFNSNNCVYL